MNWNDIGDQELAGMLEQAVMHGSNAEFAELATRVASRLRRASDRHGNLSRLVFNTSNQKERFTDNNLDSVDQLENIGLYKFAGEIVELRRTIMRVESQYEVLYGKKARLLVERDEARRNYCHYVAADRSTFDKDNPWYKEYSDDAVRDVAKEMGWNDLVITKEDEEKTPQTEPNNDEPPYDKYDGVLPADLGTDRP